MQSRLVELEQESGKLKELMIEKHKEAMFDVLTKIPNRMSYEKKAAEEIARCKRFATPLSMAVWDIDLFKQVNDTYGHKVGDKVLKAVAQLLEERMRETDYIADMEVKNLLCFCLASSRRSRHSYWQKHYVIKLQPANSTTMVKRSGHRVLWYQPLYCKR